MKTHLAKRTLFLILAILFILFLKPSPLLAQTQNLNKNRPDETSAPTESKTPATMIEAIQQRNADIDKRTEALDLKEQRLRIMEQEISKMIKEHTKILETINQKEAQRDQAQEARYSRLAKIYEKMPPEDAATRISRIEESLALNLLRVIKPKTVAQILSGLSPAKAAQFSEKLIRKPR